MSSKHCLPAHSRKAETANGVESLEDTLGGNTAPWSVRGGDRVGTCEKSLPQVPGLLWPAPLPATPAPRDPTPSSPTLLPLPRPLSHPPDPRPVYYDPAASPTTPVPSPTTPPRPPRPRRVPHDPCPVPHDPTPSPTTPVPSPTTPPASARKQEVAALEVQEAAAGAALISGRSPDLWPQAGQGAPGAAQGQGLLTWWGAPAASSPDRSCQNRARPGGEAARKPVSGPPDGSEAGRRPGNPRPAPGLPTAPAHAALPCPQRPDLLISPKTRTHFPQQDGGCRWASPRVLKALAETMGPSTWHPPTSEYVFPGVGGTCFRVSHSWSRGASLHTCRAQSSHKARHLPGRGAAVSSEDHSHCPPAISSHGVVVCPVCSQGLGMAGTQTTSIFPTTSL
ncbi:uncharacterized protein [Symphalangus syndactylus]|uniref:uncharacterized protein n=1 Tax=Symphalangus syndactylus TaxID=9590 RepID=UPI003006C138